MLLVLLISQWTAVAEAFAQAGIAAVQLRHDELHSGQGPAAQEQLSTNHFQYLWIDLPTERTRRRLSDTYWRTLRAWIDKAASNGVLVCLVGNKGLLWQSTALHDLLRDGRLIASYHGWCRYRSRMQHGGIEGSEPFCLQRSANIEPRHVSHPATIDPEICW